MIKQHLTKPQKWITAGIFLVFLLVGLFAADDYGIAWDEPNQQEIGKLNFDYMVGKSDSLITYHDRFYGAAFEWPLFAIQKALHIEQESTIYHLRHIITHVLFITSLGFFFALSFKLFQNFKLSVLGILMLYLHPRIFAHSFFNSKDLVFLSVFIIGLYTLFLLIEKPNQKRIFIHAAISSFLIGTRILGIVLPFISLLIFIPTLLNGRKTFSNNLKTLSIYFGSIILLIHIFWPALWTDPFLLGKSFLRMSHFPFQYDVLFQGNLIPATQIPWNYIPVWIGITTPPFILLLSIIGFIWLIRDYIKSPEQAFNSKKQWFILVIATFPIDFSLLLVFINSTLYDGWRQLFFLYPMIVIAALYAFQQIENSLKTKNILLYTVYGFLSLFIFLSALKIYKLHPYEQVYFNHFVSKKNENRRKSFEMDYWGLSYYEGINYVVHNDSSKVITICFANAAGINNLLLLPPRERARIHITKHPRQADYFITNYRYHPNDYEYKNEVFKVERDQNRILSVFKINNHNN